MKTVVVASTNPVKLNVAKRAFQTVFPDEEFDFQAVPSQSGVPEQPMEEEARQGARNRLAFVQQARPDADYWIGQEGGLCKDGERLLNRAWIAVSDKSGFIGEASTLHFNLPQQMTTYINEGMSLGKAGDLFFGTTNANHGDGAIGYLTDGLLKRADYYTHAAIIALSELKHQDWYK